MSDHVANVGARPLHRPTPHGLVENGRSSRRHIESLVFPGPVQAPPAVHPGSSDMMCAARPLSHRRWALGLQTYVMVLPAKYASAFYGPSGSVSSLESSERFVRNPGDKKTYRWQRPFRRGRRDGRRLISPRRPTGLVPLHALFDSSAACRGLRHRPLAFQVSNKNDSGRGE